MYDVFISDNPIPGNIYRNIRGVNIDNELLDVGPALLELLYDKGVNYVTVDEARGIEDRSWEMSVALAALGEHDPYASGTVVTYVGGKPTYGKVLGLNAKAKSHGGKTLQFV